MKYLSSRLVGGDVPQHRTFSGAEPLFRNSFDFNFFVWFESHWIDRVMAWMLSTAQRPYNYSMLVVCFETASLSTCPSAILSPMLEYYEVFPPNRQGDGAGCGSCAQAEWIELHEEVNGTPPNVRFLAELACGTTRRPASTRSLWRLAEKYPHYTRYRSSKAAKRADARIMRDGSGISYSSCVIPPSIRVPPASG